MPRSKSPQLAAMAGKGGLLSRITASITKLFTGKELVGFDFNGNRYYRHAALD